MSLFIINKSFYIVVFFLYAKSNGQIYMRGGGQTQGVVVNETDQCIS